MSHRFFTADFHIGMPDIIRFEQRPFKSVELMDAALLHECNTTAKVYKDSEGNVIDRDVIYHLGDLFSYGLDQGNAGSAMKPNIFLSKIASTFVNIKGNHDLNNRVKSLCSSMHIFLSKRYPLVSLSHYPTYDMRTDKSCLFAPVHLCGHVHRAWRHCLDLDHRILNVNVGVDVWGFKLVSDDDLMLYLNRLFKQTPDSLFRCKLDSTGKLKFYNGSSR